jgi:hypothetical protein
VEPGPRNWQEATAPVKKPSTMALVVLWKHQA